MAPASLLLEPGLREQVTGFFEPRCDSVDTGCSGVHEGIAFLHESGIVPTSLDTLGISQSCNADLARVVEVIATVAWSDMSSAFSLWCHRMVMEYMASAPVDSPLRIDTLPRLLRTEILGSTALAAAIANHLGQVPLPIVARLEGDTLVLNGRITWASNLFAPDFVIVTAIARADDGQRLIVALPGGAPGVCVDPHPRLLALQATGSSSLVLRNVRLDPGWIVTEDFDTFIQRVRPPFLLLQSSFCWGLAERALAQGRESLRGVAEVFRSDLETLESQADNLAGQIRSGTGDHGRARPLRDLVQLRLDCARLTTAAVALEAKIIGGRGYVNTSPTARRFREAAFLPIQSPT
ncbi:MAG TPA: acyl-CoA dehydrogenase family protein, partial [Chloroflexota bacterium]|nr:acyl-CoA dehydrogenase family protein [Chloroflexota bacterium]